MFWLILTFVFIEGWTLTNSEHPLISLLNELLNSTDLVTCFTACKRFETVEVQKKFYWARKIIPWTTKAAENEGWNKISTKEEFHLDIYRFQQVNNFFIFYYKNNLVGVGPTYISDPESQMTKPSDHLKDDVDGNGSHKALMDQLISGSRHVMSDLMESGRRYAFKHTVTIENIIYKYALILFVGPDILKTEAADPCCSSPAIYFEGSDAGDWHQVPILESQITNENNFMDKQGCLKRFGNYYFYHLNDDTKCKYIHGFFSFYDNHGDMAGFGVFYEGSEVAWQDVSHPNPVHMFWNFQDVKEILPHSKRCIAKNASKGYTSISIFIQPSTEAHFVCSTKVNNKLN